MNTNEAIALVRQACQLLNAVSVMPLDGPDGQASKAWFLTGRALGNLHQALLVLDPPRPEGE